MKRLLFALIPLLQMCSCSPSPPATQEYTDKECGFRIQRPIGWQKHTAGGHTKVLFNEGGRTQINVACQAGSEKEMAETQETYRRTVPEFAELEGQWVTAHERRAFFQTISWSTPYGKHTALRLYVPTGDRFFTVTAMSPTGQFDEWAPLLRECVMSFEVLP